MKLEAYLKQGEGKTLEFKENANPQSKIVATAIAFANTSGGRIIIGVDDKTHYVMGVNNPHSVAESLANLLHDTIEPRLIPNIEVIPFRNTHVVVIEIYPSQLRPHFEKSKGKLKSAYVRIGSTTRIAGEEILLAIERSARKASFDKELCSKATEADLDVLYIQEILGRRKPITKRDLINFDILTKERDTLTPTIGGILLFSSHRLRFFPDAWVQIGLFEGRDKSNILSTHRVTSFLHEMIDESLNHIKNHLRVGLKIEDIHHEEVWELPKVALREAITNAIIHTDYSLRGAPIRIAIFDDRVEIENSAVLLGGLTLDDMQSGVSQLRNRVIGRVFQEIGVIENWGSGIERMMSSCRNAGLFSPRFEEIGSRIRVTFYRTKQSAPRQDAIDQKILEFIKEKGSASTQEIVEVIGLSRRATITRLAKLVEGTLLKEIALNPKDPKKRYELT